MRAPSRFSYAVYRLVPRVERGERINVGVVVFAIQPGQLQVFRQRDAEAKDCVCRLAHYANLPAISATISRARTSPTSPKSWRSLDSAVRSGCCFA